MNHHDKIRIYTIYCKISMVFFDCYTVQVGGRASVKAVIEWRACEIRGRASRLLVTFVRVVGSDGRVLVLVQHQDAPELVDDLE